MHCEYISSSFLYRTASTRNVPVFKEKFLTTMLTCHNLIFLGSNTILMGILSLMKRSISFILSTSGKKIGLHDKNNISLMNCFCNTGSITDWNMKELGTLIFIIVCKYVYFFQKKNFNLKNGWQIRLLPFKTEIYNLQIEMKRTQAHCTCFSMLYTCITNTLIREENESGVECLPIYSHIIAVCLNFGIALSTVLLNFWNILLNIRKQNILLYKPWKQLMKRINQEKPLPLRQQILMI